MAQRGGTEADRPGRDDAAAPPDFRDIRHIQTKNWWAGKKVLISSRSAHEIDWTDRLVNLDVERQRVKDSRAYDAHTLVDRAYEKDFHRYYSEVQPSDRP